jgi:hypothetical protein
MALGPAPPMPLMPPPMPEEYFWKTFGIPIPRFGGPPIPPAPLMPVRPIAAEFF